MKRYLKYLFFIPLFFTGAFFWAVKSVDAATFQVQTGYYVGDGADNRVITGIGFQPQLVIIKDDTGNGSLGAVWKSSSMSSETSALLADTTADISSDAIQSLDSDGFTLGTNLDVNGANVRFTWEAFGGSDCTSSGTFCVGSYTGDGTATHALTTVGFQPNLVAIKSSGATSGAFKTSGMSTNVGQAFSAANEVTDGTVFKTLDSTGFTVGSATRVNSASTNYWFFAFKTTANAFAEGTFTGDGTDNRAITAAGFRPSYVWLKNSNATTPVRAEFNVTESNGDYSGGFSDTNNATAQIKSLDSSGFTIGTDVAANESGKVLYWVAFGGASNFSASGTYKMKVGSYSGNGTSQSLGSFGFAPDLVIVKDQSSATQSVFRTKLIKGDSTAYLGNTVANFTGGITSLDSDGFSVGADTTVNTNGTTYQYQAFGNAFNPEKNSGASDFAIGAYTGVAVDNRNILRQPFQPDLVVIKANSTASGMWRTSDESGDASVGFSGVAESTDNIQGFNSDGFQVGTSTRVNGGTTTVFNFFTFKSGSTLYVNHYTGTGSAQNITSIGFSPNLLWLKSTGTANAVFKPSPLGGNATLFFVATAVVTDRITALLSNGFSVGGNQTETNTNTTIYRYAAWKINTAPNTPSLDSPSDTATGISITPSLLTTATDSESDYLRYKIELCTDSGMTTGCQTFDQTSSQTGWSGQNTQSSTAYTIGTQATYVVQSSLSYGTTYYWRSYAIDPAGSITFSSTQTPYSFTTLAVPSAPSALSGTALTTTSIQWSFTDNATNENGFLVQDTSNTTKCTVSSASSGTGGSVNCTESGLTANTSYTRKVVAYNAAGNSTPSSNASAVTYSTAPTSSNVTGSIATSTWTNNSTFTFTNTLGFGSGSVEYFRYVWDTNSTYIFNGTETQWTSGTLPLTATSDSNSWYLHLQGYNSSDVANGSVNLGPYYFDGTNPGVPGTPSTTTPTNSTSQNWSWSTATDALSGVFQYLWRTTGTAVASGTTSLTNVATSFAEGLYTFFVKSQDNAGNESSESSSSLVVDTTNPASGSITYTDGYTNSTSISLTVDDGTDTLSGIDTTSRTVKRAVATLSGGNCGLFGSFVTVSISGSHPNFINTGVSGNCYMYEYLVSDNAGNQVTYSSSNVIKVDATAPTITGPPTTITPTSSTSQDWTWSAASDSLSGISNYLYRTTGTSVVSGSTNSASVTTNLTEGTYTFFVKAVDNAGNQGAETSSSLVVEAGSVPTPQNIIIVGPSDNSFTSDERPVFKWKSNANIEGNLSRYEFSADDGELSLINISPTGSDFETSKYIVHYENFSDNDSSNDYISVQTKSSTDWNNNTDSATFDGKLKEGLHSWKVKVFNNSGGEQTTTNTLYVDRSGPVVAANYVLNSNTFQVSGRVNDDLVGYKLDKKVSSGPENVEIQIQKEGLFGIYSLFGVVNIHLDKIYWSDNSTLITDNTLRSSGKYADFSYSQIEKLSSGRYKIIITGKDKANNSGSSYSFIFQVGGGSQITEVKTPQPISQNGNESFETNKEKVEAPKQIEKEPITKRISFNSSFLVNKLSSFYWWTIGNIKSYFLGIERYIALRINLVKSIAHLFGNKYSLIAYQFPDTLGSKIHDVGNLTMKIGSIAKNAAEDVYGLTEGARNNLAITSDVWLNDEPTKITNTKIEEITQNSVVIKWQTNHFTVNNKVNYGETLSYGQYAFAMDKTKEHGVKLTNLKPNTKYVFEIMSQGKNYAYDSHYEFTTKEED